MGDAEHRSLAGDRRDVVQGALGRLRPSSRRQGLRRLLARRSSGCHAGSFSNVGEGAAGPGAEVDLVERCRDAHLEIASRRHGLRGLDAHGGAGWLWTAASGTCASLAAPDGAPRHAPDIAFSAISDRPLKIWPTSAWLA